MKATKGDPSSFQDAMPCSANVIEYKDEMFVEGKSKFLAELVCAKSIP